MRGKRGGVSVAFIAHASAASVIRRLKPFLRDLEIAVERSGGSINTFTIDVPDILERLRSADLVIPIVNPALLNALAQRGDVRAELVNVRARGGRLATLPIAPSRLGADADLGGDWVTVAQLPSWIDPQLGDAYFLRCAEGLDAMFADVAEEPPGHPQMSAVDPPILRRFPLPGQHGRGLLILADPDDRRFLDALRIPLSALSDSAARSAGFVRLCFLDDPELSRLIAAADVIVSLVTQRFLAGATPSLRARLVGRELGGAEVRVLPVAPSRLGRDADFGAMLRVQSTDPAAPPTWSGRRAVAVASILVEVYAQGATVAPVSGPAVKPLPPPPPPINRITLLAVSQDAKRARELSLQFAVVRQILVSTGGDLNLVFVDQVPEADVVAAIAQSHLVCVAVSDNLHVAVAARPSVSAALRGRHLARAGTVIPIAVRPAAQTAMSPVFAGLAFAAGVTTPPVRDWDSFFVSIVDDVYARVQASATSSPELAEPVHPGVLERGVAENSALEPASRVPAASFAPDQGRRVAPQCVPQPPADLAIVADRADDALACSLAAELATVGIQVVTPWAYTAGSPWESLQAAAVHDSTRVLVLMSADLFGTAATRAMLGALRDRSSDDVLVALSSWIRHAGDPDLGRFRGVLGGVPVAGSKRRQLIRTLADGLPRFIATGAVGPELGVITADSQVQAAVGARRIAGVAPLSILAGRRDDDVVDRLSIHLDRLGVDLNRLDRIGDGFREVPVWRAAYAGAPKFLVLESSDVYGSDEMWDLVGDIASTHRREDVLVVTSRPFMAGTSPFQGATNALPGETLVRSSDKDRALMSIAERVCEWFEPPQAPALTL